MASTKQLERDIKQALARTATPIATPIAVLRITDRETNVADGDPGMAPPSLGDLGVGRAGDSYKDLYWTRLASEYKKEKALRDRGSETALRVSTFVNHAPSDRSPVARVDWPDPMDISGATKFARQLVEDGAEFASVQAHVSRPTSQRGKRHVYNLAHFERALE